jgi:hypothetical protein
MITRRKALRAVLVLFVLLLAGSFVVRRLRRPAAASRAAPVRTAVSIPPGRALDSFAVSPNGNTLAYAAEAPDGRLHLFLRQVDSANDANDKEDREVAEAAGAHDPFFSPDGRFLGYFSRDAAIMAMKAGA